MLVARGSEPKKAESAPLKNSQKCKQRGCCALLDVLQVSPEPVAVSSGSWKRFFKVAHLSCILKEGKICQLKYGGKRTFQKRKYYAKAGRHDRGWWFKKMGFWGGEAPEGRTGVGWRLVCGFQISMPLM